jgi:hypothetical protein
LLFSCFYLCSPTKVYFDGLAQMATSFSFGLSKERDTFAYFNIAAYAYRETRLT